MHGTTTTKMSTRYFDGFLSAAMVLADNISDDLFMYFVYGQET
jgi:hypothetical protein